MRVHGFFASTLPELDAGNSAWLPPVQVAQGIVSMEFIQAAMHRLRGFSRSLRETSPESRKVGETC